MSIMRSDLIQNDLRKIIPVIKFARKTDINKYLKLYKIDLEKFHYKCLICGRRITKSSDIGTIISNGEKILIICSKQKCLEKIDLVKLYENV